MHNQQSSPADPTERRTLRIVTINIENIKTNRKYLEKLAESHDIILIQEHWLYNFEQKEILTYLEDFDFVIKSSDDNDPILPLHKPRGKAGVAIFWRKTLSRNIEQLTEGCERLVAIQIHSTPKKICIINTYMPTRCTNSTVEYNQLLDELHEIFMKYKHSHDFIWAGDLNASLIRDPPNKQDLLLMNFFTENHFELASSSKQATFFHYNSSQSQIDYIFSNGDIQIEKYTINEDEPLNVSTHTSVSASFCTELPKQSTSVTSKGPTFLNPRIKWDKIDTELYKEKVKSRIDVFDELDGYALPSDVALKRLSSILTEAARESITAPPVKKKCFKNHWPPEIIEACKAAKSAHWEWKKSGQNKDSPLYEKLKLTKKSLRQSQRQYEATKKVNKIEKIMQASNSDQNTFFKLIRAQRNTKDKLTPYIVIEKETWEEDRLLEGWATYFERLAKPKQNPLFDEQYRKDTELNVLLLEQIEHFKAKESSNVTPQHITTAIKQLKNKKAADRDGITAEHLKLVADHITGPLAKITQKIQDSCLVPNSFKAGLITPILKKGKIHWNPDHYRRITVTPIPSKLFEKITLPSIEDPLGPLKSKMQRGFSKGSSSANAAFLLTESIAEAYDNKTPLYITMLDASKAFDVVSHDALMQAMHLHNITGPNWLLMKDWYSGMTSQIKWKGELSREIEEGQGLRQGGGLSAGQYITYTNKNLISLEDASLGLYIGTEYIGCPTCADDTALVHTNPVDMQVAINLCQKFASQERFTFSSSKTKILVYDHNLKNFTPESIWSLNNEPIECVKEQIHLGINRVANALVQNLADEKIQAGRRTTYSLFGAGMHGLNGLNPKTAIKLWKIYVIPRMLYGLDIVSTNPADISKIEDYQRKTMKQLQHLPPNTSNPATYLLCGVLPIQAEVDKRCLSAFVRFISNVNSAEYHVIKRQAVMKDLSSKSWLTNIKEILHKYELPSVYSLLQNTPTKSEWKLDVKKAITKKCTKVLLEQMSNQSTTKYINTEACSLVKPHHVWTTAGTSIRKISRANVKVKILTGTYNLQGKRMKFKNSKENGFCKLCQTEIEDRVHFIVRCPLLQECRVPYLNELDNLFRKHVPFFNLPKSTDDVLTRIIIDPSFVCKTKLLLHKAEELTQRLVYTLHHNRSSLLDQLVPPQDDSNPQPAPTSPKRLTTTRRRHRPMLTQAAAHPAAKSRGAP